MFITEKIFLSHFYNLDYFIDILKKRLKDKFSQF